MGRGFLQISLFTKNKDLIDAKNKRNIEISGLTFVLVTLVEFVIYVVFSGYMPSLSFVVYDLCILTCMLLVRGLYGKVKDICDYIVSLWYLLIVCFTCQTFFSRDEHVALFNYLILSLALAFLLIMYPVRMMILQTMGLIAVIMTYYIYTFGNMDPLMVAEYTMACMVAVIVGLITTYLKMVNLLFERETYLFTGGENDDFAEANDDLAWSGRNKYGILSGEIVSKRKIFSFIASITKARLTNVKESNIFNLKSGMTWDEVRENIIGLALDPATRKKLSRFLDMDTMLQMYKTGKRRYSVVAGFNIDGKDKRWYDMECIFKAHPVSGELFVSVVVEDITEERILMGVLNKIVGQNYDFVMCIEKDKNRTITFRVARGEEIKGEYRESYEIQVGSHIREHVLEHDRERALRDMDIAHVRKVLSDEKKYEILVDELDEEGNLRKKLYQYSYLDRARNFMCLIRQDVTEVIEKENEAKKALDLALQEKEAAMNARSEFMTRMSHEMRTPMNAILGLASVMMDEINNPDVMRDYISKVQYSGQFLLQLINDVLDITKMNQDKMTINETTYSFGEFWEAIDTMIGPMCLQKGVDFEIRSSIPTELCIKTDALRITQVFINLLSNAVKYTPKGGQIVFECKQTELDENRSRFDYTVSDNGIGMSEEFQQRMFEPFSQESQDVSSNLNGTGLGLSIVKGIVESMGGTIKIDSAVGEGTSVHVSIEAPVTRRKRHRSTGEITEELKGKRILLVEDNDINREIAVTVLQKKGMLVEEAVNGSEAVEKFSENEAGYYDAILMDIRMPVMNGLVATKKIRGLDREDAASIPIIAMTANAFGVDIAASLEAGMNEHLSKPIEPKVLYKTIAKYMV